MQYAIASAVKKIKNMLRCNSNRLNGISSLTQMLRPDVSALAVLS